MTIGATQVRRERPKAMLQVTDLSCELAGHLVLEGVSLTVLPGQITVLLGPNGAGKSTLVDVIGGQLRATSGTVVFDGRDVTALPSSVLTHAGLARTFQVPRPLRHCTVWDNVFVAATHGRSPSRHRRRMAARATDAVLARAGLTTSARQLAGRLPPAQLRRLDLARAMALDPLVLVVDEPMAGLDDLQIDQTVQLLLHLREEGVSILAVEHVMHAVLAVADTAVFLHCGTVLKHGRPDQVLADADVMDAYLGAPPGWGPR
ncbi:ATP-binding cassette domain-containing protein [Dermatophilaceae bacterium Sec6.4]